LQRGSGRKRIVVVNYYPLEFWGGGEILSRRLLDHLGRRYEVEYLAPEEFAGILRTTRKSAMDGALFSYRRIPFRRASVLPHALVRPVPPAEHLERADLLMIFLDRPPAREFLRELADLGKPTIFLLHGLTFEKFSAQSVENLVVDVYQAWMRLYLRMSGELLRRGMFYFQVLNESQASFLEELGVDRSRIFLVPNSVDFSAYKVSRNDSSFRIIYMGRLERLIKGTRLLERVAQEATKLDDRVEFLVMGSGSAEESMVKLATRRRGVVFRGQVNDPALKSDLLSSGNMMVSFSTMESFSISLLEGLASGLPILCTDTSGPRSIVGRDPRFGRVLGFDVSEFIDAIEGYLVRWSSSLGRYFTEKLERRNAAEASLGRVRMEELYESIVEAMLGP
jgi:glycosyltransferase involved in cell wall biosynthesis